MHRLLPHAADLRAELTASDFEALCGEAAALVRSLLVRGQVAEERSVTIALEAADPAERFFRFVRELVYLADCDGFLVASCTVAGDRAELRGELFDPRRHAAERQIKALTRHRFRFEERAGTGLRAELVFDL